METGNLYVAVILAKARIQGGGGMDSGSKPAPYSDTGAGMTRDATPVNGEGVEYPGR